MYKDLIDDPNPLNLHIYKHTDASQLSIKMLQHLSVYRQWYTALHQLVLDKISMSLHHFLTKNYVSCVTISKSCSRICPRMVVECISVSNTPLLRTNYTITTPFLCNFLCTGCLELAIFTPTLRT